ncbi:hypothetical protein USB125703_00613 [Pseudoclavibacter triregionum]|nr:hypothetical protein USB125703_00613 [Pseudoclavibacter triregionum]
MQHANLLGIPETRLAAEPEVVAAVAEAGSDRAALAAVAAAHPASSLAWAALAEATEPALERYAYARVGYHRGLDALRKAGWRGQGPVPWSHEPNRGVLRAFAALRTAAEAIGEAGEPERLDALLTDCDAGALNAIATARGDASSSAIGPSTRRP